MLILEQCCLGVKVLATYIDMGDIVHKNTVSYLHLIGITKLKTLIIDAHMVLLKTIPYQRWYAPWGSHGC